MYSHTMFTVQFDHSLRGTIEQMYLPNNGAEFFFFKWITLQTFYSQEFINLEPDFYAHMLILYDNSFQKKVTLTVRVGKFHCEFTYTQINFYPSTLNSGIQNVTNQKI